MLVVVTLYGGNDGLNTVVPAADPAYQDARPELAYRSDEVLDLGEGLGLNPGLTGLKGLWDAGQLAVVRGVGYPQAGPQPLPLDGHLADRVAGRAPATTGWLGRWLDATTTDPLAAVSLESVLPRAAGRGEGGRRLVPARPGCGCRRAALGAALQLLGRPDPADGPWQARVATSLADLQRAAGTLGPAAERGARRPAPRRANRRRPTSSRTRAPRPAAPGSSAPSWTWWPT